MEASIRELANTLFSTDSLLISSVLNSSNIDMDINTPRKRSFSSSENNSRESSTHSNISSISYHERMENFNTFWSKQVENDEKEKLSISYATSRAEKGNMVNKTINTSSDKGGLQNNNEASALNNLPCS